MVFSSLVFLCVFFPLQMLVYYLAKGIEARNTVLILFSLVFYAWGEPFFIVLLLFMCFVDWAVSQGIYKYRGTGKSKAFYTFQLLSYMVDVYRQEVPAQPKFRRLLLYVSLFHQCIAGPIVRYKDVSEQILCRHVDSEDMRNGINRFVSGLAKKVLLANVCGSIASRTILSGAAADQAANLPTLENASALTLWLGCFAYALQIYLDFSAYSDMAIGMGLMVGFRYKENFNYPYLANSITDFWRRWHMSLSSFFRDYVYIPLGGNRKGKPRQALNLLIVWFLTGMWQAARLLCPPVHAGGGVLWLGAVLLHRFYPGHCGAQGPVWPKRQPPHQPGGPHYGAQLRVLPGGGGACLHPPAPDALPQNHLLHQWGGHRPGHGIGIRAAGGGAGVLHQLPCRGFLQSLPVLAVLMERRWVYASRQTV